MRPLKKLKDAAAALERQVIDLERKAAMLAKRPPAEVNNALATLPDRPNRFVAKGLRALRARLGLSAAQLAALLGASEQSAYNWKAKKAVPRKELLAAIIDLRSIGKRDLLGARDFDGVGTNPMRWDQPIHRARTYASELREPPRRSPQRRLPISPRRPIEMRYSTMM